MNNKETKQFIAEMNEMHERAKAHYEASKRWSRKDILIVLVVVVILFLMWRFPLDSIYQLKLWFLWLFFGGR